MAWPVWHSRFASCAARPRLASLLIACLALLGLHYLQHHMFAEHHELYPSPLHSHAGEHHEPGHDGAPSSGHLLFAKQPESRFDSATLFAVAVVPAVPLVFKPLFGALERVPFASVSVPPATDVGPTGTRGPPRCHRVG